MTTRRDLMKAAAWAVPVVAMSAAVPLAAASTPTLPPKLLCISGDPDVENVIIDGDNLVITFTKDARNSVDVTIRPVGEAEIHYNFVPQGTPTNGVPHMKNYTPGDSVVIPLPRNYDRLLGDWLQVKTIHNENCVEVPR